MDGHISLRATVKPLGNIQAPKQTPYLKSSILMQSDVYNDE